MDVRRYDRPGARMASERRPWMVVSEDASLRAPGRNDGAAKAMEAGAAVVQFSVFGFQFSVRVMVV